jgi:soluble lytic murein transglycosylase
LKPVRWLALRLLLVLLLATATAPAHAALNDADRQTYRETFQAVRSNDWLGAWKHAGRAHDPLPAKVLRWLDLSRGNNARFSDVADFIAENPDWPGQLILRQRAEETLLGASDKTLSDWFERYPPVTATGKIKEAEIWINEGRNEEGIDRIRDVWINCDLTPFEEKTMLQRYHEELRYTDHVHRLDRLLWDGQFEAAKREMTRVGPDYRALAEARMRLATMARGAEQYLQSVPAHLADDPGLLFERLHWRTRKERYAEAIAMLDHPPEDLVRPVAWAIERQALARHALSEGDVAGAYRLAARHGLTSGPVFAELEFFAGWLALRFLHQPELAYNHFVRLYDEVKLPVSVARGAYWAARAATALGYQQLAAAWYETASQHVTTYYGQLAAIELGEPSLEQALIEPQPTPADVAAFEQNELVRVTRDLADAGAGDFMRPFILRLSELAQSPAEHALITHLAAKLNRPDLAVAAAKRASYVGVNLLAAGYPIAVLPTGGAVEQPLVLAMSRQESAFDREAVSSAGARGMMQLMPATARHIAKTLKMSFSANRLTSDWSYNITLGRAYLGSLLNDFSGSYVLAIAAYNIGPGRVKQWMRDYGDPRAKNVDVVDWIESIPVGETRNYVQRVLENLQIYRVRTGDHGLALSLASDLKR